MSQDFALLVRLPQFQGVEQQSMAERILETGVLQQVNDHTLRLIQNPGFWVASLALTLLVTTQPAQAQSQIEADGTLGNQPSQVIQNFNGLPTEVIIGGAQRGQNLFHSLREFNIDSNYRRCPARAESVS
jgi:hypothetical protein